MFDCIWIVTLEDVWQTRCFEEIALSLQSALAVLGYNIPIITTSENIQGNSLILGANILALKGKKLPPNSVIYNLEHYNKNSFWFSKEVGYLEFLKKAEVWDFSPQNIKNLKLLGIKNIKYCPIGYMPQLSSIIHRQVKDIDVLFIGAGQERRLRVLSKLKSLGIKIHHVKKLFGEERNEYIARAKIVLNIHSHAENFFEMVRVSYLLANRVFVISEEGDDKELEKPFENGVVFSPYQNLVQTCVTYLNLEEKREKIAEVGFDFFSKQSQVTILENILSKKPSPRIFVQIVSYRDPECWHTITDLFAKAARPERVFVGLCQQVDPVEDLEYVSRAYPNPEQVRELRYDWRDAKGAGWARASAQKLWQGEEYILQIQAHMRFEHGWDETLIDMLARCEGEKKLISAYLPNYIPPDNLRTAKGQLLRMRVREFGAAQDPQILHLTGIFIPDSSPRAKLSQTPFWIGNFLFAPAALMQEVPFDPHIFFYGEEISYSARLWTHGWNIFEPDKVVLYHQWSREESRGVQTYRKMGDARNQLALQRIKQLLQIEQATDQTALIEIEKFGLGNERPIAQFWEFAGINPLQRTVAKQSLQGKWNMPGEEMPRIFVQIASYRDRECQWTVKDLFEKASYPERITVGVCWQFDAEDDADCFEISTRPEQVRISPYDWREGEGVCWARNITQSLWEGEEYTLQIDAHMRFMEGWDELLIEELALCDSQKPVLSCNPASYTPPDNLQANPKSVVRVIKPYDAHGNLRGQGMTLARAPERPLNGAFIAAGFVFARSEIISECPYDPYLYFDQEEIAYGLQLYTKGWDVFSTRKPYLYHYYNTPGPSVRPLHWRDLRAEDEAHIAMLKKRGQHRFDHLVGYKPCTEPDFLQDLEIYALGSKRSLQDFERYTGIDFKNKKVSARGLKGEFIIGLERYVKTTPPIESIPKAIQEKRPPAYETGDFIPLFKLPDSKGKMRAVETYAGKAVLMIFLPAGRGEFVGTFIRALKDHLKGMDKELYHILFIFNAEPERVSALQEKFPFPASWLCDANLHLAHALGIIALQVKRQKPTYYLLNSNLKVQSQHSVDDALKLAALAVGALKQSLEQKADSAPVIIRYQAPALIVPDVFTPEFCHECIRAFDSGKTFDGTVGGGAQARFSPQAKIRTDMIVQGELLRQIDEKLSKALFPEIEKVFGFKVTRRELYKIGCYDAERGGFFRAHRDNFDPPLGYRRIAMTLHLNEEFEGGGLRFPEYGNYVYKPPLGAAILFSCNNLHEALHVTEGKRFIMVSFFHGENEEAYRREYQKAQGTPDKNDQYELKADERKRLPHMSRDFVERPFNKPIL